MSEMISTPVGRLVQGSTSRPRTTDMEGRPLVFKSGPNAGQPRSDYFLALAVPKAEAGPVIARIKEIAAAEMPSYHQSPAFAWKFADGDTDPKYQGKEGCAGCIIFKFSGAYAPACYRRDDHGQIVPLADADAIKRGYYVRIAFTAKGNESTVRPGLYLNHSMVMLEAYGEEINSGPDANAVFGAGPATLPAGASATPVASGPMPSAPPPPPAAPTAPAAPGFVPPSAPAHDFLTPPAPGGAPVAPPPPVAPAAPASPQLTAKANGATYEQMTANGWTDELLRQHGYLA